MAKNNKTRFFYVLYSDKTRVFGQSERAYYPIYIIKYYINEWLKPFTASKISIFAPGIFLRQIKIEIQSFLRDEFHMSKHSVKFSKLRNNARVLKLNTAA